MCVCVCVCVCGPSNINDIPSIALFKGSTSHRTADTSGVRWKTEGKRKINAFSSQVPELKMLISSTRHNG